MRKALIAIAVATALFAVGAFAASFAVNSEDIASGNNAVTACADLVDVDFTTVYDNVAGDGDWNVTEAKLTFYDNTGTTETPIWSLTTDCATFGAAVKVMTTGGTPAASGTKVTIGANPSTVALTPATVKASDVTSAAVLVDGENLQTTGLGGQG